MLVTFYSYVFSVSKQLILAFLHIILFSGNLLKIIFWLVNHFNYLTQNHLLDFSDIYIILSLLKIKLKPYLSFSNFCRIPIIDYHRHCRSCNYDLCLSCCQDLREASTSAISGRLSDSENGLTGQDEKLVFEQAYRQRLKFLDKISNWKANCDGNIPCPPREYGGCGYYSLSLSRIFKMNWVAKLVKNVEEMVGGCRVHDSGTSLDTESIDPSLFQCAHRDNDNDNFLYFPTSSDIRSNGISDFRKHWARGKPIIVRQVFDSSSIASWDPVVIWRGIQDTADEKMKDENKIVKAINCSDQSEVGSYSKSS